MKIIEYFLVHRELPDKIIDLDEAKLLEIMVEGFEKLPLYDSFLFSILLMDMFDLWDLDFVEQVFLRSSDSSISLMNCARFFGTYFFHLPITKEGLERLCSRDYTKYHRISAMLDLKGGYTDHFKVSDKFRHSFEVVSQKISQMQDVFRKGNYLTVDMSPPQKLF